VTTATATQTVQRRRVRVWFGEHVIADYNAEPALAERYADAMSRRFAGLRRRVLARLRDARRQDP